MLNVYRTSLKGELRLNELKPQAIEKLRALIRQKSLDDVISISDDLELLYINGSIDNSDEVIERFLVKIIPLVDISDNNGVIKAQGDSPKDRYDFVLESDGLYIQYYKFEKDGYVKYNRA